MEAPNNVVAGDRRHSGPDGVVLRTKGLTKTFGTLVAVNKLDLDLRRGETFGFLGPNGAGKTTTVGMVLGLIQPTSGGIELFGQDLRADPVGSLRRVGALIDLAAFYPYLSALDNLRIVARMSGSIPDAKIGESLEVVGLSARAKDRFGTYSTGMKQRLGIAAALVKDPELLILDEPTSGLDPAGTKEVRELIPKLAAEGRTIFLCSHLLHEVELTCQRVAIIKQGSILAMGRVDELLRRGKVLQVRVDEGESAKAAAVLRSLPWVASAAVDGDYILVEAPVERAKQVTAALAGQGIYLSEMRAQDTSLESFFLEVTEEAKNGTPD